MRSSPTVYRDQSAQGLRLTVVGGRLDLRPFAALDRADICLPGLRVGARILGASHLIEVEHEGRRLHEVFACADVPEDAQPLYSSPLAAVDGALELELRGGGHYRFGADTAEHAAGRARLEALASHARRAAANGGIGLNYAFPASARGDRPPRTIVCAELSADRERIVVSSAHSYPNEGSVVFSETAIELRDEGRS
jgi:hypothetical protein